MPSDPPDGLTDELADEISAELDLGPEDDIRALAAVRPGDDEHVALVLYDEDGEQPDVAVELTRPQARELAAKLLATADAEPGRA